MRKRPNLRIIGRPSGDVGVSEESPSWPCVEEENTIGKAYETSSQARPPSPVSDDPLLVHLDALAALLDPVESLDSILGTDVPSLRGGPSREMSRDMVNLPRSSPQLREVPQSSNARGDDVFVVLDPAAFAKSTSEYLGLRDAGANEFLQQEQRTANPVPNSVTNRRGPSVRGPSVRGPSGGQDSLSSIDRPPCMSQWRMRGMPQDSTDRTSKGTFDPATWKKPQSAQPALAYQRRMQVKFDGSPKGLKDDLMANPYVKALRTQRDEIHRSMDLNVVQTAESLLATERADSLAMLSMDVVEYANHEPALSFLCSPEPCAPEPCSYYLVPEPCSGLDAVNSVASLSTEELCEVSPDTYMEFDARRRGVFDDTAETSPIRNPRKGTAFVQALPLGST